MFKFFGLIVMLEWSKLTFPPISSIKLPIVIESDNFGTLLIVKGLSLSIDAAIKAAVVAPDFINSKVTVRIQFFDQDWVTSGDGLLYFIGSAASQNIASGQTSAITVSCKSRIASLSRPRSERYSDQEQQAQYPGDLGMQYASELASKTIIWPSSEWFKEDAK